MPRVQQHLSDRSWQLRAACRGPQAEVFYPPVGPESRRERAAREARAKAICAQCAVRRPCLDFALRTGEAHGVWGGLSESERHRLLRR